MEPRVWEDHLCRLRRTLTQGHKVTLGAGVEGNRLRWSGQVDTGGVEADSLTESAAFS